MTETVEKVEAEAGSEPLKNARWETFAQGYAIHANASRAYVEAGYKPGPGVAVSAHHLLRKPNVEHRVHKLKLLRWQALAMTNDELIAEVSKLGRFNIGSITHVTPAGDPYIDLSKATPDDLAAITEVSIEDFTDGREVDEEGNTIKRDVRRVKVKAPNKVQALTLLARIGGMLKDKVELSVTDDFAEKMLAAQARVRAARSGGEGEK